MRILFALNQNKETTIEENILSKYKELTSSEFEFVKEYDLSGVNDRFKYERFDVLVLNEELERDNTVTTTFIDDLTDKFTFTRVVLIIKSDHEKDAYVRRLFNIGVYDVLYAHDITIENIVNLIANPRTKAEAKIYLDLHDIDDVKVESELRHIPEEQLNNILNFFDKTDTEKLPSLYEHIYYQYNERQMIFLHRHLTDEIKNALKGNELFDEIELKAKEQEFHDSDIYMDNEYVFISDEEKGKDKEKSNKKPIIPSISINIPKPEINIGKTEGDTVRTKLLGSVLIGVANSVRGAGSSFVSMSLASFLKKMGFTVAILELNKNPYFSNLAKDKTSSFFTINGVDIYFMPKGRKDIDFIIPEFDKSYQYVISDLGIIKSFEGGTFVNNSNYQEFIRCNVKLLMISGQQWKWGEVYPFLVNEKIDNWNLLVSPTNKKTNSIIHRELSSYSKNIYTLPFCENPLEPTEDLMDVYKIALKEFVNVKIKSKFKLPSIRFGKQGG